MSKLGLNVIAFRDLKKGLFSFSLFLCLSSNNCLHACNSIHQCSSDVIICICCWKGRNSVTTSTPFTILEMFWSVDWNDGLGGSRVEELLVGLEWARLKVLYSNHLNYKFCGEYQLGFEMTINSLFAPSLVHLSFVLTKTGGSTLMTWSDWLLLSMIFLLLLPKGWPKHEKKKYFVYLELQKANCCCCCCCCCWGFSTASKGSSLTAEISTLFGFSAVTTIAGEKPAAGILFEKIEITNFHIIARSHSLRPVMTQKSINSCKLLINRQVFIVNSPLAVSVLVVGTLKISVRLPKPSFFWSWSWFDSIDNLTSKNMSFNCRNVGKRSRLSKRSWFF